MVIEVNDYVKQFALRHFQYCLKGLLKGFWWPFRLLKSVKYFWSYGPNEVCNTLFVSSSPVPCFLAQVTSYVFYLPFEKKFLSLVFMGLDLLVFIPPTVYIYCYYLFCQLSSLKQKYTFQRYAFLLIIFLCLFPCGMYQSPFLLCFLQFDYICLLLSFSSLFLYYNVQILLFIVLYPPIPKTLYFFLFSFLSLHLDLFSYSIPHHLTC